MNFKARFFKEESNKNNEDNDKKKELSVFSGHESEEKGKDIDTNKNELKNQNEKAIPYYPSPSYLYQWEGQDGPLKNQLIKEYYNLLCL